LPHAAPPNTLQNPAIGCADGESLKSVIIHFLLNFHGPAGYVGVFVLLVACGLGLPLPEDIALISGGFLAAVGPQRDGVGVGSVWLMMLVGLVGILVGDSIIFKAGKDYGDALLDTRLGKHIPKERIVRIRELFAKHGSKLIILARFVPGLRAVTYFVAGTSGVSYPVFIVYDGAAALVSAPVWVWLGYWMGSKHAIQRAFKVAGQFQLIVISVFATAAIAGLLLWYFARKRAAAKREMHIVPTEANEETPILPSSEKRAATGGALTPTSRPGIERA
jgi:membrane protein DedA with SNARE-associated domain